MFNWRRPTNLGVTDGRLAPCKRSPNCVSSQADPSDPEHYIAPIRGSIAAARGAIKSIPRTTIVEEKESYLYAEFRTRLLRYVDDVELYFDGQVLQGARARASDGATSASTASGWKICAR